MFRRLVTFSRILAAVLFVATIPNTSLMAQQLVSQKQVLKGIWRNQPIEYVDGEVFLKLKDGIAKDSLLPILSRFQAKLVEDFDVIRWHLIELPNGMDIIPVLKVLQQEPMIEAVEPNMVGHSLITTQDPHFTNGDQWYLSNWGQDPPHPAGTPGADIHISQAWAITSGDPSVKIGILDSGIPLWPNTTTLSHPDLNDANRFILGQDFIDDSASVRDKYGHGTMVTGIASANTNNGEGIAGIAGGSKVIIIKTLGDNDNYNSQAFLNAITYAHSQGVQVINFSAGQTNYSSALEAGVQEAYAWGILLVCGAGNHKPNDPPDIWRTWYPARFSDTGSAPYTNGYSNVIAVAATDPWDHLASYSCTGRDITASAPGGYGWYTDNNVTYYNGPNNSHYNIITTTPNYYFNLQNYDQDLGKNLTDINQTYGWVCGTSLAAPMVTGTAALILSINPNLAPSDVRDILRLSTDVPTGWNTGQWGSGRVNAYQALLMAQAYSNKSTINIASWNNSGRHLAKGSGKLHEVFTTGGEILYRRQDLASGAWEATRRISSGNDMNSDASIVVAHDGSLHAVWQRQTNTTVFDLYYSRSLDNGNSWSTPTRLALNITIASNQWNIYPVIAERNSAQLVVVFCCSAGLEYCTSSNNGVSWSTAANIRSSYVYMAWYIWYPSMASGSNYLTLTYDYRYNGVWSMTYNGTTWSSESNVNAGTGTVYDRFSSVAVLNSDNPVSAWCSQKYVNGQLDPDFRIMFRRGNPDNTWGSWFVEFAKTTGISDLYPSIASYSGGEDLPYGIDILYHRTNQEVRSEVYNSQYTKWQNCLFSGTGQWPNLTLANPHLSYPVATWTDQSSSPYELKLSSSNCGLPKTTMTQYAQHRRAILQNRQSSSTLSLEVNSIKVVSASGDTVALPFKKHGISDTLNITLGNIWDYLGTDTVTLPTDVNWLLFDKTVDSEVKHDSGGSLGISNLAVLTYLLQLIDEPSGTQLAVLDANPNSSTAIASISPYAGRSVVIRPSLIASNSLEASVVLGVGDVFVEQNIPTKGQTVTGLRSKPERLTLDQNYPNPFNPTSTINYALPFDGQVVLKVYDVLGREVKTLVDQLQSAGYKSVTFDASSFSNGIYFYRLEAVDVSNPSHSFVQVRKMLLLK